MLRLAFYGLILFSMTSVGYSYPESKSTKNTISPSLINDILKSEEAAKKVEGPILEVIQVKSYTYLKVKPNTSDKPIWLATSTNKLVKGDRIRFVPSSPMEGFYSKTLKRTFTKIYFVENLEVARKVDR